MRLPRIIDPRRVSSIVMRLPLLALGVAVIVGLLPPSEATASVVVGPQQITVTAHGARATITRRPFHVSIDDGAGVGALSEVASPLAGPKIVVPTVYPTPLGGAARPDGTAYAPLTFLVGSATTSQWTAAFWQGDQLTGRESGIQYSAQNVIDAGPAGDGVALTLSTNDPSRRRLLVTVSPGPGPTIRVRATASPSAGVAWISDAFASGAGEAFHGFGGRHNAINQHGRDFYSWIEQENTVPPAGSSAIANAAAGQPNYMFPTGPTAAYQAQALFYSSRPYGFPLDQPDFARWRMDSGLPDAWRVDVYGAGLNYVVAPGRPAQAIASITAITGRQRVPPAWALGPQIDRVVRAMTPETAREVEAEVRADIANFDRYQAHVDGYRFEGWAMLSPSVLASLISELRKRNIHPLVYSARSWPIRPEGSNRRRISITRSSITTSRPTPMAARRHSRLHFRTGPPR